MRKRQNSSTEWILLGSAAFFFGNGSMSYHFYMTQVFVAAASEERAVPYSILSICLGVLPLCVALYCFDMECFQAKTGV